MREAVALVRSALAGEPVDSPAMLEGLRRAYEDVRLGPSTAVIVEEARRRGIPVRRLNTGSLVQPGVGPALRRIRASPTDATSIIGADIAQDKDLTKRVLHNIGLSVPVGAVARSAEGAAQIAREIG